MDSPPLIRGQGHDHQLRHGHRRVGSPGTLLHWLQGTRAAPLPLSWPVSPSGSSLHACTATSYRHSVCPVRFTFLCSVWDGMCFRTRSRRFRKRISIAFSKHCPSRVASILAFLRQRALQASPPAPASAAGPRRTPRRRPACPTCLPASDHQVTSWSV